MSKTSKKQNKMSISNRGKDNKRYELEISVVIPCLNEEKTIGKCILDSIKACKLITEKFEIIIVDNNCTDRTVKIAKENGAKVVKEKMQGYGAAYKRGFNAAKGKYIVMGDGDNTYDFLQIPKFYSKIQKSDFVIGDRFKGKIEEGGMPFLHKIGNPILSFILRTLFKSKVNDAHCGLRIIKKNLIDSMNLSCNGMEFASEMIIKASKLKANIKQIPIIYRKREGESKLSSFRDGWYHLRFMLLFSPNTLFFIPGLILFFIGILILTTLYITPVTILGIKFSTHPMIIGSLMTIIGMQIIITGYYLKILAMKYLGENNKFLRKIERRINLGNGILFSLITILIGAIWGIIIIYNWINNGFSALDEIKQGIIISTIITISIQIFFSSLYFISLRTIQEKGF